MKELIDIMASGPSSWVSFLQRSGDPHPRAKTHKTLIKRHKDFEMLWRHLTEMTLMNCSERQVKVRRSSAGDAVPNARCIS